MPLSEGRRKPVTYSNYLKVDELLDLQQPLSDGPEHDEMLFIIIHQVYELWFKQILHELRKLRGDLEAGDTTASLAGFKRILTILKTLVAQVDILETITPVAFSSFRDRLESASGFQSVQFREVEFILGHKNTKLVRHHIAEGTAGGRLQQLLEEHSLYDSFLQYLKGSGYAVPDQLLDRDVREPLVGSPEIRELLLEVYRNDPLTRMVCERMVDLDEGIQEWRYRHVKMVERTIGSKPGTGGSAGADYLKTTLFKPLFPDLWAIRTEL